MNHGKFLAAALILALGMTLSAGIISKLFFRIRLEQSITVKGYAEANVESDFSRFRCRYTARGSSLPEAYAGLAQARKAVTAKLLASGFTGAELAFDVIDVTKVQRRDAHGKEMNEVEFHDLAQSVTIESTNVYLVRDTAVALGEMIKDNIDLTVFAPSFYVSDLQATKLKLMAEATADGCKRATTLAENSGGRVGKLTAAKQGVFQITTRNSTDVAGYGIYDESTIDKTVKAIVTLEYEIKSQ